jgi:hypothetical protein
MVRYDIGGKEKEMVYEQYTVREIAYFDENEDREETAADADMDAPLLEAESKTELTTNE